MWYLRLVWLLFIYPNILFSAEMKSGEVCTEQNFNTLCCQGNLLTTCADRPTANYCTGCNSITLPATPSPGCAITLSCTQRTTETCCKNKPGCYWDIATTTCKKPIQCAMLNGECGGCITSLTCSQRHSQTCCDRNSSCKWSNNTCSTATCRVRNFGRYKIPPGRIGWVGWGFDGEMACNMSDDNSLVHIQYGRTKTGRCSERGTCSVSCNNNGELTRINECLPRCSSSRIPKKGVIYPGDNGFGIKPTNKSHCFPGYRGYVSGICKYDERIGFGIIQNKEDHCIRAKACGVSRKIVSPGGYSVPSNQ